MGRSEKADGMKPDAKPKSNAITTEARAELSEGTSHPAIYAAVESIIRALHSGSGTLVDAGCGSGSLWKSQRSSFDSYVGLDVVEYPGFPDDGKLMIVNLDEDLPEALAGCGDVVASVETIEHLENPRAFMRKLARVAKPGGVVIVTTPNQLSLLSKLTLIVKNQFNAFQERPGLYPAHMTALLAIDLLRIANECGLEQATIRYTNSGRIPFTPLNWPKPLGGRAFSDNVLLVARKPAQEQD